MRVLGNIIWVLFGGLLGSLAWLLSGLLLMLTVIGVPLGMQCLKIAQLTLWPFGRDVEIGRFGAVSLTANIIWLILLGWELFLYHLTLFLFFTVTLVGIPFARQHAKLALLALVPFSSRIR